MGTASSALDACPGGLESMVCCRHREEDDAFKSDVRHVAFQADAAGEPRGARRGVEGGCAAHVVGPPETRQRGALRAQHSWRQRIVLAVCQDQRSLTLLF